MPHSDSKIMSTAATTDINDDIVAKFKATSQPATRTPSPSRIGSHNQLPLKESNRVYNDENSPFTNFDFVAPKPKFSPKLIKKSFYTATSNGKMKGEKKHFYRSFSASHTPRPSIGGNLGLSSLGEAPCDLPDASTALLMANSSVSILSVNLNEELLRAAVNNGGQQPDPTPAEPLSSAPSLHSLPGEIKVKVEEPTPDGSNKGHSRKHSLGSSGSFEF